MDQIKTHCTSFSPQIILVGNKNDLEVQRQVSYEEGLTFASKNNLSFIESSAKTRNNINQIFETLVREVLNKRIFKEASNIPVVPVIPVAPVIPIVKDLPVQLKLNDKFVFHENASKCCK